MNEEQHLEFTPAEVEAVMQAIRKANEDMDQWRKESEPTQERIRQKINMFRNGKVIR